MNFKREATKYAEDPKIVYVSQRQNCSILV